MTLFKPNWAISWEEDVQCKLGTIPLWPMCNRLKLQNYKIQDGKSRERWTFSSSKEIDPKRHQLERKSSLLHIQQESHHSVNFKLLFSEVSEHYL